VWHEQDHDSLEEEEEEEEEEEGPLLIPASDQGGHPEPISTLSTHNTLHHVYFVITSKWKN